MLKTTSRRGFLSRALGTVGTVTAAALVGKTAYGPVRRLVSLDKLEGLVDHATDELAKSLGLACGKALSKSMAKSPEDLVHTVFGLDVSMAKLADLSAGELKRAYLTHLAADHRDDRMIEVDGWLLAESEAALYALVYSREH